MYCSELLKYVRDVHNYKIRVLYGYKFENTHDLFTEYVNKYYNIKSRMNDNISINRTTAKLMLNSLYGRTGMRIDDIRTELTDSETSALLQKKYDVKSLIQLTPDTH